MRLSDSLVRRQKILFATLHLDGLPVARASARLIDLVADGSSAAFLLVALARKRRFEFRLLTRRHEESVLFRVFDDLFCHHSSFEAAQGALNRFTLINVNDRHYLSIIMFSVFTCSFKRLK